MHSFQLLIQESLDVETVASGTAKPQPLILWNGQTNFVIIEKQITCTCPVEEAAVALLGTYYVFNIEYSKSFNLLGTFFDIILLDIVPRKVPSRVSILLSALSNV